MSKALAHAQHNENACNFLTADPDLKDWVVTTAFYSALHYVNHKMFPGKVPVNGKHVHCNNFSEYYAQLPDHLRDNKHRDTINLVWQVLTEIGPDYKWLFDQCHDARYKSYKVSQAHAERAKKTLEIIRDVCNPPVASANALQEPDDVKI